MSENNGAKVEIFSQMPTERIENMLRYSAMSDEELDMETINCLLTELKRREGETGKTTVMEAWKDFIENWSGSEAYLDLAAPFDIETKPDAISEKKVKYRKAFRTALVAAIVVVLMFSTMIVAQASGLDVFGGLARWTDETFSFGNSRMVEADVVAIIFDNWTEGKIYDSLQDALDDFAITEFFIPELPEGSEQKEVKVSADLEDRTFSGVAAYAYKGGSINIRCKYAPSGRSHGTVYEKSGVDPEVFIIGDYTFYLFPNNATNEIVWLTENFECSVGGDLTYDELKQIIESIY